MAPADLQGAQINWNHVFYFSEIAAAGSIKNAAEKLRLSPSTLSAHLSQLESDLGVKLFHRQHRKLLLSPGGSRLFQHARQMFETGKRFIDVLSPTPLGFYPVAIGIVPGPSYAFAHSVIQSFLTSQAGLSLNVSRCRHEELEAALLESRLDFGFTDRRSERKDIVQAPVVSTPIRFFVSSKLANESLREVLKELPLLLCRSDSRVRSAIEDILDELEIVPKSVVVSEYPSLVERLCRQGAGVAALGRLHLDDDPEVRMLRLPRDFPVLTERLYATWVSDGENLESVKRLKPLLELGAIGES